MSIEQDTRLFRWDSGRVIRKLFLVVKLESALVIVIREDDGVNGLVKVCRCWSMDGQWPQHPIRVLKTIVAMVPCCTILRCIEYIAEGVSWGNGALSYPRHTVHEAIA